MSGNLSEVLEAWRARWPQALALWSSYARLSEPLWCLSARDAQREHLTMSFAMIRLTDHAIVLNIEEIAERGLTNFPLEVMGHEIGHHIYCPGDLTDQGRLLARVRRGLPGFEDQAPLIANLYADLFINDRLQRGHGLHLDSIYASLGDGGKDGSVLWHLYLRIYEHLWRLDRGTLVKQALTDGQEGDARLGARLIRVYARDWLKGASSFAALCLSYMTERENKSLRKAAGRLLDSESAGGAGLPDGLTEMDDDELGPVLHPSEDPAVAGDAGAESADGNGADAGQENRIDPGGHKSLGRHRGVDAYRALMKQLNPFASDDDVTAHYYRERARPYLIRFPERVSPVAQEPILEGLETWDIGRPLTDVDWVESVTHSPHVVPGITTLARVYGETPGADPHKDPLDLYVGIDCSGSMPNPRKTLSYPVLAGFIVALSALRAGARVMACLSGEPGKSIATDGFRRDQDSVSRLLTDYLGSGYSYGIFRLEDMAASLVIPRRPTHVLILTDTDIFSSLAEVHGDGKAARNGWSVAEKALRDAGGGGTLLLHATAPHLERFGKDVERIRAQGWRVASVSDWEQVLEFARQFSRQLWSKP
jgi:hypothetical protein